LLHLAVVSLVEPMLVSRSTGVSMLALVVAAAFWAWLWGPVGLVVATPLTAVLAVLGKYVPQLEFFDVVLSVTPARPPPLTYYRRLLARDEDEAFDLAEAFLAEHAQEDFYEKVLVPALLLARSDRERGDLSGADEEYVAAFTARLLDELLPYPADEP